MHIHLFFFGPARDFAGVEEATLDLPDGATVADLRPLLTTQYPDLGRALASIRLAVNESFATDGTLLNDGDEVALIPPVSGGEGEPGILVYLVREPIDAASVRAFVTGDASLGGVTTFEGVTRCEEDAEHGSLVRLDYQAYDSMALKQLERLASEAKDRWSAGRVAIVHRIGPVPPGEASVIMAVACAHRAESFEACRWLIDTLKKDVPIWKKDVFADGFERWVQPPPE